MSDFHVPSSDLEWQLQHLPHQPGVYLMKNRHGTVIYVGKALVLAHRVKSYFQRRTDGSPKTRAMVEHVASIDTVVTGTELEALLLENNLIKKYRPKYNVILRDDKSYPMLRLPMKDDFPRLEIVRRIQPKDKGEALYFGPYIPSNGLYEMLKVLRTLFPLPNCTIEIDGKAERPCIEFEIKRCLAPCTGNQSKEAYQEMIQSVRMFLEGKDHLLLKQLHHKMTQKAEEQDYEEAARIRDQIAKIKRALERQRITSTHREDQDVVALFTPPREGASEQLPLVAVGQEDSIRKPQSVSQTGMEETIVVAILFIRNGMVMGKKAFFLDERTGLSNADIVSHFLSQFYDKDCIIPKKVMLPLLLSDQALLQQWLSEKRGEPVHLVSPSRGAGKRLIDLAMENAKSAFESRFQTGQKGEAALIALQQLLHLSHYPRRIEGYDISNIMGTSAVGSMVVFEGGVEKKADYRHFKIKTIEGANDFAMMAEMMNRRVKALREENAISPDLLLIDGGKGQISAVQAVLETAGLGSISGVVTPDLIGLAKEKNGHPERVYLHDLAEPIILPLGSPATYLLMQVRDEAHRFAVSYHRKVRSKKMLHSPLEEIAGIGKRRRLALLRHFGSLEKIRAASLEEIEKTPAMNKIVARQLFDALHA